MFIKEKSSMNKNSLVVKIVHKAALVALVSIVSEARGELVLEEGASQLAPQVTEQAVIDERESTRQIIGTAERAQVTVQSAMTPAPEAEVQNLTQAELTRRERVRTEMKNEDILQVRLEELRLRDEQKRTAELLGVKTAEAEAASQATPIEEVAVGSAGQTQSPAQSTVAQETATTSVSATVTSFPEVEQEKTRITVQPRGGVSNLMGSNYYSINSRFTGGLSLGAEVSENLAIEFGYQYSEYGVSLTSTNPWVLYYQSVSGYYQNNYESVVMKQNIVDLGVKVPLMGRGSKVRPFIGGGGAYSKSYINYDQSILALLNRYGLTNLSKDYELSQYLGYVSTGVDVQLSKSISIGALFKYYGVLSSNENQALNNAALYGSPYASAYGNQYNGYNRTGYNNSGYYNYNQYTGNAYSTTSDTDKQNVGSSLARSAFYSAQVGITFSF